MIGFRDVQQILDGILGEGRLPRHGAFWNGVSRDEFITNPVSGLRDVIVPGDPAASNLIKALRGIPPFGRDLDPRPPGAFLPRMPQNRPPASEEDIQALEGWIAAGCPEVSDEGWTRGGDEDAINQTHIEYWRAVDLFFLPIPGHASPETVVHVNRIHFGALVNFWLPPVIEGRPEQVWLDFLADADNQESVEYIRHHQRRLIGEFYDDSQDLVLDSLWKFGGSLLPDDPERPSLPEHRMNGVDDWFFWVPHLDACLRSDGINDVDLALARGWQVGIVADGLLRTDDERPEGSRMPIPDYEASTPDLKSVVLGDFAGATAEQMLEKLRQRARDHYT